MKQADIAMLILIVSITLMLSFFIGNAVIGGESNRSTEVEVVEPISSSFPEIGSEEFSATYSGIFNRSAVNPTQTINIGNSKTESPFSSGN